METIEYKKVRVQENDAILEELLQLSEEWADEKTCPSYNKNDPSEFIDHDVYLALEGDRIVAYALGHISVQEEETSYNKIGEKAFELDEIYVARTHRDKGIGKELYRFLEKDIWDRVDVIGLVAVSYQYKKLLEFYIEELDLQFNHALLVKRTHEKE
ncbi:GNAT family N-acetyltransferase [Guggenheimella bovis]